MLPTNDQASDQANDEKGGPRDEALMDDTFFGLSLVDAARKYLRIVKRKKSTKEVMQALEAGGFTHTSKNFFTTVFSALQRESEKEASEIVKVGKEWGLMDWYPGMRKKNIERKQENEE